MTAVSADREPERRRGVQREGNRQRLGPMEEREYAAISDGGRG